MREKNVICSSKGFLKAFTVYPLSIEWTQNVQDALFQSNKQAENTLRKIGGDRFIWKTAKETPPKKGWWINLSDNKLPNDMINYSLNNEDSPPFTRWEPIRSFARASNDIKFLSGHIETRTIYSTLKEATEECIRLNTEFINNLTKFNIALHEKSERTRASISAKPYGV